MTSCTVRYTVDGSEWRCPRPVAADHDRCVFHLTPEERAAADVSSSTLRTAFLADVDADDPARREYVDINLAELDLSTLVVDGSDVGRITFRDVTVDGTLDLSEVESVQDVRAVWNGDEWELHFVCKVELEPNDSAGDGVAGIDLGIKNIATVAFPDEYVLYPGNAIKQDKHYFKRVEYDTGGENGPSEKSMWARRKLADRETHFYHVLSDTIITECIERGVGTLAVSWPEDVRESDWGKTGNKRLHSWAFDRIYQYLAYKGEIRGVEVLKENEWNTSKNCSQCGDNTKSNRKHRGLYVCSSCGLVANADCNGAENMRQKITPSPHGEDRSNGCVAQPSVHLSDSESGAFAPREQVVS